ncbi:cupin domain-containing protein [Jiangella muralis]|uniref:cupin domain-containing protein n=1 Tax=Jiangella muralis TaxID=702383 RepID=UPI00069F42A6|nr:cupin domain-containing protein [Jiangella muralis]
MSKPEHEFFPAATVEFTRCAGDVPQLTERILAADAADGVATRILRFEPGTDTTPNGVQVHDFWEEVYIVEGSLTDLRLNQTFVAGSYACRPPGMPHGPWRSDDGCLTFEVRYRTGPGRTRTA